MRLRVPGDVAVVSFDDPPHGELFDPPITALARNERYMGELAATLLLHALQSDQTGPPAEVRLPVRLIIRRSCGCPETSGHSARQQEIPADSAR
jgi:LacI family transcriptional regulator